MTAHPNPRLAWWLRLVGAFYLLQSIAIVVGRAPIRTFGPDGVLDLAGAGDPVAGFVVDTWMTFGLEVGAVGAMMLVASRVDGLAPGVAWTVMAIEIVRGLVNDVVFIARGIEVAGYLVWIVIHTVIIITGLVALRATSSRQVVLDGGVPDGA